MKPEESARTLGATIQLIRLFQSVLEKNVRKPRIWSLKRIDARQRHRVLLSAALAAFDHACFALNRDEGRSCVMDALFVILIRTGNRKNDEISDEDVRRFEETYSEIGSALSGKEFVAPRDGSPFESGAHGLFKKCSDMLGAPGDDLAFMKFYPGASHTYLGIAQFLSNYWPTILEAS